MNPLDQLKDIHLPPEVGMWLPAYGWWILTVLVLSLFVASLIWLRNRYKVRLAKRQALVELSAINRDEDNWPQQLNRLLKRVAITYFPHTAIATLHDKAWAEFLAEQLPTKKRPAFLQEFLLLQGGLYRNNPDKLADFAQSTQQIGLWIKHAKPPKPIRAKGTSPTPVENAHGKGSEYV
jgi:hypothetical protein